MTNPENTDNKCTVALKGNGISADAIVNMGSCKATKSLFEQFQKKVFSDKTRSQSELKDALKVVKMCQKEIEDIGNIANKIAQKIEEKISESA